MFALIFLIVIGENCIDFCEKNRTYNLRRQMLSEIVKQMFVWSCVEERFTPLWYRV